MAAEIPSSNDDLDRVNRLFHQTFPWGEIKLYQLNESVDDYRSALSGWNILLKKLHWDEGQTKSALQDLMKYIGNLSLVAEIVTTEDSRERGLIHVKHLPQSDFSIVEECLTESKFLLEKDGEDPHVTDEGHVSAVFARYLPFPRPPISSGPKETGARGRGW